MTPERFARLKQVLARRQPDLTVILEDVHKPHNLAAVTRTCDAVGVGTTCAIAPQGMRGSNPKAFAGSRRWVRTQVHNSVTEACQEMRAMGMAVLAAHPTATARDFRDYDYTRPTALLLGSELRGLSAAALAQATDLVRIPMQGMGHSLNVSVCAALILYEAQRQRQTAGLYDEQRIDDATYRRLLFEMGWPRVAHRCRRTKQPYPSVDLATGRLSNPGAGSPPG